MKTISKLLMLFVALLLFSCGGSSDENKAGADSTATQTKTEEKALKVKGFYGGNVTDSESQVIYTLHLWEINGKIVGRLYNSVYGPEGGVVQSDERCFIENAKMEGNKLTFTGSLHEPFTFEGTISGNKLTADISYPQNSGRSMKAFPLDKCCTDDEFHQDFTDEATWMKTFKELDKLPD